MSKTRKRQSEAAQKLAQAIDEKRRGGLEDVIDPRREGLVQYEGMWHESLDEGHDVRDWEAGKMADGMPLEELLRAWRNHAEEILSLVAAGDAVRLPSELLVLALGSLAVMRRAKSPGTRQRLSALRAVLAHMRSTGFDAERLRAAIGEARQDVDEIAIDSAGQTTSPKKTSEKPPSRIGNGGPKKTLDAVRRAILRVKGESKNLADGDETMHEDVMQNLGDLDHKKAADYIAPSGRLSVGGWLKRDGDRVILTKQGASDGNQSLRRERQKKKKHAKKHA